MTNRENEAIKKVVGYVPIYATITKVLAVMIFLVAVAATAIKAGSIMAMARTPYIWLYVSVFMAVWFLCDFAGDLVIRIFKLAEKPSDGFYKMIQSMGGVCIAVMTTAAVIGMFVLPIPMSQNIFRISIFLIISVTMMILQLLLAARGMTGNTLHDMFLNFAQQIFAGLWIFLHCFALPF